jgi:hypothetical protein
VLQLRPVKFRTAGPFETGSDSRVVELYDADGNKAGRIFDAGDRVWQCDMCQARLQGGVCISAAVDCCESCARRFADADPEQLLAEHKRSIDEGLGSAGQAVEDVDHLVAIYPRWRLVSRWKMRRNVLGLQRRLEEDKQDLRRPERRDSFAEMVDEFGQAVRIIDEHFRAEDGTNGSALRPRPLTQREREVLDFLLSAELPGVDELRRQAETVYASPWRCGCASIDLHVDRRVAPASPLRTQPAIEAETKVDAAGLFELLLWVDEDGWLSSLEIVDYVDPHGSTHEIFPPPSDFEKPASPLRE